LARIQFVGSVELAKPISFECWWLLYFHQGSRHRTALPKSTRVTSETTMIVPRYISIGNKASTELLGCSVISNWTGRPVFFWTIVARCRTFAPEQMSSNRSLTRSHARSLLSMARLKMTRSRHDRAISRRTRMDQTCFGWRGRFWRMSNPLFQGRWSLPTERTSMGVPPPPRPPMIAYCNNRETARRAIFLRIFAADIADRSGNSRPE
jgi:hypothetical protein